MPLANWDDPPSVGDLSDPIPFRYPHTSLAFNGKDFFHHLEEMRVRFDVEMMF